jgi:predicted GH43/DUF377 family glycosyl hydrolase
VSDNGLATRLMPRLRPDASRVVGQLFVPGHSLPGGREGRASGLVEHLLALTDDEVDAAVADVVERFGDRHADLAVMFEHNAERIANRLPPGAELSPARRLLLGATFTQEYAVEAAALCNPSVVVAPGPDGAKGDDLRFVMSVRQIGEGHRSTIGFRTGSIDSAGAVTIEPASHRLTCGSLTPGELERSSFAESLHRRTDDAEAIAWVLDGLAERFTVEELDQQLSRLEAQGDSRRNVSRTVRSLRGLAARSYGIAFPEGSDVSARVLHPVAAIESNGMEDARFVRFTDDDGTVDYYATYTAYDGVAIAQQLLRTTDFVTFSVSPLVGAAAANKGLALFPRRIGGRFAALTRNDGSTNAVAFSDDLRRWPTATPVASVPETWAVVQVGNCGSPIEVDEGWLVLTHGVGPMRTYSIGACLLDLDDPTKVLRRLHRPLLRPQHDEQDGYVPNVVYSCGALRHGETVFIPYGIGDSSIGLATVDLGELLAAMS